MRSRIDISTANPKQVLFFKARRRFVAYGGARGGGKSWAVRKKAALLAVYFSGIKILIVRRTFPDLKRNHIYELQLELKGVAKYNGSDKVFRFANGSTVTCGYCDNDGDLIQYQGPEFDVIFIDEATQFLERWFDVIKMCLRGVNDFPKRMYLTCNPGGPGHEWVKRLFIRRAFKEDEDPDEYEFIRATTADNAALMLKDKGYMKMLDSLPPALRKAWRDGDWDVLAGRYFEEFDEAVHVIKPVLLKPHWKVYRAIDYGLDCFACVWAAVDERGVYYIFREYAGINKIPAVGAAEVLSAYTGRVEMTLAPPDLWSRSQESGKSKVDIFRENGLYFTKSNANREAGWLNIKELLAGGKLFIFEGCAELIRCLKSLQRDIKNPNDCTREPHDVTHLPDALRYFCSYWIGASHLDVELPPTYVGTERIDFAPEYAGGIVKRR